MSLKDILLISARIEKESNEILCSVESYICLFVFAYCDLQLDVFLIDEVDSYKFFVDLKVLKGINYVCLTKSDTDNQDLTLPVVQANSERTSVAGICAVLRYVIKSHCLKFPDHHSKSLLGFRGGCLVACTESSMWTKFCELQLPTSVKEIELLKSVQKSSVIPSNLILLEAHLQRPVRTHNILKRKLDVAKKAKANRNESSEKPLEISGEKIDFTIYNSNSEPLGGEEVAEALEKLTINEKSEDFCLNHNYLEGIDLTLADLVVFPCVNYLLKNLNSSCVIYLQSVMKWYGRMCSNPNISKAMSICRLEIMNSHIDKGDVEEVTVPVVDKDSLYRKDPIHSKLNVKQKNPRRILSLLQSALISPQYVNDYCDKLDWNSLPSSLHPLTGDLPQKRIDRKCQQIESIVTATLKVAREGQTVVEFCAGGGHVGLLLAYFLPKCKVILIENKEPSILRAMKRANDLKLENLHFYQCNIDYFRGSFDLGVSLHACGVATDLVIQQCIRSAATFVCCPCCYGGVQDTHLLSYPLSKKFRGASLTYEQYTLLAHFADRTEVNTPTAEQGEVCMGLIDTDRKFFAEENGYDVILTTLNPLSCSPKHNLLVGTASKL